MIFRMFYINILLMCYLNVAISSPVINKKNICNNNNVCYLQFEDHDLIKKICGENNMGLRVFWHENNQSKYLISCECNCSSHDNFGWFVSMTTEKIEGIVLGKMDIPDRINNIERIPNIMGARHSMCSGLDVELLNKSDFTTLMKYPTNDDNDPYCFEARYINEENGNISIYENGILYENGDEEAFIKSNFSVRSKILKWIKKLILDN